MKNLFALTVLVTLAGCTFDTQSNPELAWTAAGDVSRAEIPEVDLIDGAAFGEGPDSPFVLVDLRRDDLAVGVDRRTSELGRISLLCPNGETMRWDEWAEQDAELSETLVDADDWVGVGATERLARFAIQAANAADLAAEACRETCRMCPDGAWVCTSRCESRRQTRPTESAPAGEGPDTPPHPGSPGEPGTPPSGRGGSGGGASGTPGSHGASPGGHPGGV